MHINKKEFSDGIDKKASSRQEVFGAIWTVYSSVFGYYLARHHDLIEDPRLEELKRLNKI